MRLCVRMCRVLCTLHDRQSDILFMLCVCMLLYLLSLGLGPLSLWGEGYSQCAFHTYLQGLIFVVDSNDRERIGEAREELQKMVKGLTKTCRLHLSNLFCFISLTPPTRLAAVFPIFCLTSPPLPFLFLPLPFLLPSPFPPPLPLPLTSSALPIAGRR